MLAALGAGTSLALVMIKNTVFKDQDDLSSGLIGTKEFVDANKWLRKQPDFKKALLEQQKIKEDGGVTIV